MLETWKVQTDPKRFALSIPFEDIIKYPQTTTEDQGTFAQLRGKEEGKGIGKGEGRWEREQRERDMEERRVSETSHQCTYFLG